MQSSAAVTDGVCAVCGALAALRCAGCRSAWYCGKPHQRAHWTAGSHKTACRRPYAVAASPELGRHWVATRDVAAGEVLLEERPLAVGPKAGSPAPVCLACYAPCDGRYACSACGWPVCGPRCEAADAHAAAECRLIAGHYDPRRPAVYCFVLPLRCLLLDGRDAVEFRSLQSHLDTRSDTPLYRAYAVNVAAFVLDRLGVRASADGRPLDVRSVLEAAAVLDTNAFDVRRPGGRAFRAVYRRASMMSHDCAANTKHVFVGDPADGRPSIRVLATVPIGRGRLVTATYTQTLWCTRDRRRHLRAAKCFECRCARCRDPAELGTHFGSAACGRCAAGRVPPGTAGGCADCGPDAAAADADRDEDEALRRVRSLGAMTDCAGFERFLERVYAGRTRSLHADHHVAVNAKYALAQLYAERTPDLTIRQLKLNTKICEELLRITDTLEPGITRFRGLLHFYLVRGLKRLQKVENNRNYETAIENNTIEAKTILKTEPDLAHLIDQL